MAYHCDKATKIFTITCDYCREAKIENEKPGELFAEFSRDWKQPKEDSEYRDMCPACWARRWKR